MTKRCKKCHAPLEGGFLYRHFFSRIFYLKPSRKRKGYCNHCENSA